MVTLFDSYSYDSVSAGIWVIQTGGKYWGRNGDVFDGYSYDGVSAGVWLLLCYASDVKGSRFQVLDCAGEYIKSA